MSQANVSMSFVAVKEVKLKWKKLRDSYRDALKRQSEMLARDPSNPAKKNYPWKYMGLMQFLQPHMSVRKKPAECAYAQQPALENGHSQNGGEASSSESDSEPESSPKRKSAERLTVIDRKLDYLCKAQSKRQCTEAQLERRRESPPRAAAASAGLLPDPLDIFFNSMCQSTKRFSYPTQIKIKKTLFEAVIEAEQALVAEQQSYASLWAARAGAGAASTSSSDRDEPDDERKPS